MAKQNLNFSLLLLTLFLSILLAGCGGSDSGGSDTPTPTPTPTPSGYKLPDTSQTHHYCGTSDFPSNSPCGEDSDYPINPPSFTVTDNNKTVTDNNTGLVWQRDGGNGCGSNGKCDWSKAKTYCNSLQLAGGGWRLPNYQELVSIVDYGRQDPAIDTSYFPGTHGTHPSFYWSSTVGASDASDASDAWSVNFSNGDVSSHYRSDPYYVRCVRGGQ